MKSRTTLLIISVVLFTSQVISGQTAGNSVTDQILSSISERAYTTVPVTDQQLDIILKCGVKAPSANNLQPWRFTVIKDETTMKEIIKDVVAGNVLIIVSAPDSQQASNSTFDCGLATENMFIAAHGLGLGARIYGSPTRTINYSLEAYQVPAGFKSVVVLRIGNVEKQPDAVSSASPRKEFNEIVNFKK